MRKMIITLNPVQALKVTNQCKVTQFIVVGYVVGLKGKKIATKLVAGDRVYATNVDITDYVND